MKTCTLAAVFKNKIRIFVRKHFSVIYATQSIPIYSERFRIWTRYRLSFSFLYFGTVPTGPYPSGRYWLFSFPWAGRQYRRELTVPARVLPGPSERLEFVYPQYKPVCRSADIFKLMPGLLTMLSMLCMSKIIDDKRGSVFTLLYQLKLGNVNIVIRDLIRTLQDFNCLWDILLLKFYEKKKRG